jgi:hypothetical protein
MMQRQLGTVVVPALVCLTFLVPQVLAGKAPVKITKEWRGSVAGETVMNAASPVITTAREMKKLWKTWKLPGKTPEVDFAKEIVVVITTQGSGLHLVVNRSEKSNLEVVGMATLDFQPGFRYVIATVPREGIKTVNGDKLPKS